VTRIVLLAPHDRKWTQIFAPPFAGHDDLRPAELIVVYSFLHDSARGTLFVGCATSQ